MAGTNTSSTPARAEFVLPAAAASPASSTPRRALQRVTGETRTRARDGRDPFDNTNHLPASVGLESHLLPGRVCKGLRQQ